MPRGVFKRPSAQERFDAKWRLDPVTGCHVWTASDNGRGYGQIQSDGKMWTAHRFAWFLKHGTIPSGLLVCHHCDVPLCVNVDHLFLASAAENVRDMDKKGRRSCGETHGAAVRSGERHPKARLTDAQVEEMCRQYAAGGVLQRELAEIFGCGVSTVSCLIRGTRRK